MKGSYTITVQNRRVQYKFTLNRNITILRGDSATGKTTVIRMIDDYRTHGAESGISVTCRKECIVLSGKDWRSLLSLYKDSIIFIDEGEKFVSSVEFADAVKNSDNYYVIATREPLFNLPYSVREIYGIKNKSGNRYQGTKRLYSEFYPLNDVELYEMPKPDTVIVEDSNAAFEFYENVFSPFGIICLSANGNSNIFKMLTEITAETVLVIADGAAFGAEIERILAIRKIKNIILYLPESFEWVILKSGLIENTGKILDDPSEYIDSALCFSWERFFTALLTDKTKGTYLEYRKSKLNKNYLHNTERNSIMGVLPPMK